MTRTMTRIGAALLGLILTAAAALSLMIPAVADEPADTESWMQIAQTIVADLDAGVAEYVDGDHAGAASASPRWKARSRKAVRPWSPETPRMRKPMSTS